MKMRCLPLLSFVTLLSAGLGAHAAGLINVKVHANETKSDGLPWDGCPSTFWDPPIPGKSIFGNIMYNPAEPNPPEMRLLILDEDGNVTTHQNATCNDTVQCEFENVPYSNGVLGFVLMDVDATSHDLIEAVVLVPSKSAQWQDRAQAMRKRVEAQLPRFAMAEVNFCRGPRAAKKLKIEPIALDECPSGVGCELGNSFWTVDESDGKVDAWKW